MNQGMAMTFGWKTRVGIVLSAVWLCLVFLVADEYHRISQVLGLGMLPLVVIWGIVWAVAGWRAQQPEKAPVPELAQLEAKARRIHRVRVFFAVVVVLVLGLFAATTQFKAADNEAGGHVIASWFGEWLVYGLFAYFALRAVPKLPAGFPAVIAALVIVGAVNYKTYTAIAEDRQAISSLAKAMPLINKIQSGKLVEDQEVKAANVGMLEPLLLAEAAYVREALVVAESYQKAIGGMQPELMLTPASLASPSIRAQTRSKLILWQQATANYKTQLDAATARGKLAIQAAQSQMPQSMSGSISQGFDDASARFADYLRILVETEGDARQAIAGILDLLDANPGAYVLDKGPPPNLLFRDEGTLTKYRELMGAMMNANQREQDAQARLIQAQTDQTTKLGTMFKR